MRLGDLDAMATIESEAYMSAQIKLDNPITQGFNSVVHRKIQQLIADTPTIDAVPVVRCRECEYYDENGDCISLDLRIGIHSDTINYDFCHDPDFYCAYGRRKIETVLPKSDEKDESLEETHANTRKNAR